LFFFAFEKIKKALSLAKRADASMSKFSQKVENEDKVTKGLGKKRKVSRCFTIFLKFNGGHLTVFNDLTFFFFIVKKR
jgi:hypothetical protein